jgi:hypothetical protein
MEFLACALETEASPRIKTRQDVVTRKVAMRGKSNATKIMK